MTQGIYCYIDKKTNKIVYVGKDSYIHKKKRHYAHIAPSSYDRQPFNRIIQKNLNRYEYSILKEGCFSQDELNDMEKEYIKKYNPKFNFTDGGEGIKGFKHSKESREKISKNNARIWKNKHHSKETREKISKSVSKNNAKYWEGKKFSNEHKKKLSNAHKGYKAPLEQKLNQSKALNNSGYFRVHIRKDNRYSSGQRFVYKYKENNKIKNLSSVDIKKLEQKVKDKGLPWFKLDEVE